MIVLVGGHGRKSGKTAVAEAVIRALPQARWTAIKLSPHHAPAATATIVEQTAPDATDSGRFLAAGAFRSYWIAAAPEALGAAVAALREILDAAENALIESGSLARWLRPDVFLFVVDPAAGEWKPSAAESLRLADAFVVIDRGPQAGSCPLPADRPCFPVRPPAFVSPKLVAYLSRRLAPQAAGGNVAIRQS